MLYYFLFFVFLSVSLLVLAAYKYYALDKGKAKAVNDRLKALENEQDHEAAITLLREKRGLWLLDNKSLFPSINRWLVQTGRDLNAVFFYKISVFVTISAMISTFFFSGRWYGPLVGMIIAIFCVFEFLKWSRDQRIARFEAQLPDALDIIVRSLRAGHPTQTAIALASRECFDPIGTEFGFASDEIRHGLDISSALANMTSRVGLPDLIYVEAAIAVQSQSGGSLSDVVSQLSRIIRERFRLRQKVAALTSEGRISGMVLTLLPVGIGFAINMITPSYYRDAIGDPIFYNAILLSVTLLVIGHLYIQRLLKFKY